MRLVFISLVLMNLGLLTWRYLVGLPQHYYPAEASVFEFQVSGVARISLLSEVKLNRPAPKPNLRPRAYSGFSLGADSNIKLPAVGSWGAMCKTVGPFSSYLAAEEFLKQIAQYNANAHFRRLPVTVGESHWVLLPQQNSEQVNEASLAVLTEKGIDTYVIPSGELQTRVSLGVFRRVERAKKLQKELLAKGVTAEIYSVERIEEEIWLDIALWEELKVDQKVWQELVESDFSVREQENFCLDVASR